MSAGSRCPLAQCHGRLAAHARRPARPDADAARRWFAWHLGHRIIDPVAPDFSLATIMERVSGNVGEAGIAANLERLCACNLETA